MRWEPWTGAMFDSILNRAPVAPVRLNPDVPLQLEQVINKALEKDRDIRCQSAAELRTDLKRLKRDTESSRVTAVGATVSPVGQKRNLWLGVGALLVALAGITWGVYYWLAPKTVPFQRTEITRLTTIGKVKIAAVSPDGRYVAYVTDEAVLQGGRETLWVRQVGTGSDVQILPPADVGYGGLIFSRDGDFLYVTQSESKDSLLEPSTSWSRTRDKNHLSRCLGVTYRFSGRSLLDKFGQVRFPAAIA